jgi:Ribbon-helix-helix protein, copG family
VRRIQIHLEDDLDRAAAAEAQRRGVSKAALIRESLAKELDRLRPGSDPWTDMVGWLTDEPVDDIDEELYGPSQLQHAP